MEGGQCVPLWYKYITLYGGFERRHVKNIQQSWVWSREAIIRKLNYYLSLMLGPLRHTDVITSHLLFSPLTLTKYQK
jgi:hypothetical protein